MKRIQVLAPVLALFVIAAASSASATAYFVSPGGSDGNSGSHTRPFRTIQRAADLVRAGDVVFVYNGEYSAFRVANDRNGTYEKPIYFLAESIFGVRITSGSADESGSRINIAADYITLDGFDVSGGGARIIKSGGTTGVTFRNMLVHDNPDGDGIFLPAVTDCTVDQCIVYNCGYTSEKLHGVYFNASRRSGSDDRNRALNNLFFNCGSLSFNGRSFVSGSDDLFRGCVVDGNVLLSMPYSAISILNCTTTLVSNNLVIDSGTWMMNVSAGGSSDKGDAVSSFYCWIVNNTLVDTGAPAIGMRQAGAKTGGGSHIVFNNLIVTSNYEPVVDDNNAANSIDSQSNLIIDSDNHAKLSSVFRDWRSDAWQTSDFRIRADGPAHDRGRAAYKDIAAPNRDYREGVRPTDGGWDIGAYEYHDTDLPTLTFGPDMLESRGGLVGLHRDVSGEPERRRQSFVQAALSAAGSGAGGGGRSTPALRIVTNVGPNPFSTSTRIGVAAAVEEVAVYDVRGRLVRTLRRAAGPAASAITLEWDATDASGAPVPAGVYFLRARAGEQVESRKLFIVR